MIIIIYIYIESNIKFQSCGRASFSIFFHKQIVLIILHFSEIRKWGKYDGVKGEHTEIKPKRSNEGKAGKEMYKRAGQNQILNFAPNKGTRRGERVRSPPQGSSGRTHGIPSFRIIISPIRR